MKKRVLILFSIIFVFGLFATAFALSGAKVDSQSCPMEKGQNAPATEEVNLSNVLVVKGDSENCCQPGADCCKNGACCHKK